MPENGHLKSALGLSTSLIAVCVWAYYDYSKALEHDL